MSDLLMPEHVSPAPTGKLDSGTALTPPAPAETAPVDTLVHRIPWPAMGAGSSEELLSREWLVTNGLGGYASGSVAGAITRRYHALLIAALPAPFGRVAMLSHLSERLRFPDRSVVWLGVHQSEGHLTQLEGAQHLVEFRLDAGLPSWRYHVNDCVIEKSLMLVHNQNTLHVRYTLVECAPGMSKGDAIRLGLRPLVNFRPHDAPVNRPLATYAVSAASATRVQITDDSGFPPLHLAVHGRSAAFTIDDVPIAGIRYAIEAERGYEAVGDAWSPGYFRADLAIDSPVTLVASVEPWTVIEAIGADDAWQTEHARRTKLLAMAHAEARSGPAAELVLAADQFIIKPAGRIDDAARAEAAGGQAQTVIAGYHWFTDWGRDTMISLEGLTLVTGRHREAGDILRTFAQYVRDGLIPNLFPEHGHDGLYHTADATLWFFHAIDRYLAWTGDRALLHDLLPVLLDIVDHHVRGTHFNIHVDHEDGLLTQGADGYQLTWMDAKVGDWVVTPRRGKAVEINALWYNALRLLEAWTREGAAEADARATAGEDEATVGAAVDAVAAAAELRAHAERLAAYAARAHASFNQRFWNEEKGYLFDVVDVIDGAASGVRGPNDPACRPNQLIAMALRHPVLERSRWDAVLHTVRDRLLTPVGLRSLAPGHPDYKPRYFGDLRARDAAYHQGTVWAWLIGPFVDAWLAQHPHDTAGARACLQGFVTHLDQACIGSISEVFDADAPFTPRGCIAQAWSVAEVLRAWITTSSSSAAGTTGSSAPPTSPKPGGA